MLDLQPHPTQVELALCVQPFVGIHQFRVGIDPGCQLLTRGLQAQPCGVRVQVAARGAMGQDTGTERSEHL